MNHLADIDVLILGLGESGLAMARWCARCGARVTVWDSRVGVGDGPAHAAALAENVPAAQLFGGTLDADRLNGVRLVLKSPGLSPLDARLQALLVRAREIGVPVQGELDLFVRALADLKAERGYAPKLIAITGTNGKTTTTAMAAVLIERTGRRVAVAGNIGPTMLQTLADALTALPDVWVLELSSFQLDGVQGFAPDAAAVLNISEDHLDWHGSMAAYVAAKARIYGAADAATVRVVNRDDARIEPLLPAPVAAKPRSAKGLSSQVARQGNLRAPCHVVRFGLDAPTKPGDFGLITDNGMAWLVRAQAADDTLRRNARREPTAAPADADDIYLQRLMPADALRVRGRHNAANALAALALATAIGCPLAPMLHGLREYAGEPHRVQFIAGFDGIDAFDDSKGTNVGATVAAIDGLGSDRAPARLVVILGGDGKGQDFTPLAAPLERHARAVATLGRDAATIESAIESIVDAPRGDGALLLQRHATLEAATRWCFAQARAGDAVLLSPACASLDMFRNYGHRAEVFVSVVRQMAAERGEVSA